MFPPKQSTGSPRIARTMQVTIGAGGAVLLLGVFAPPSLQITGMGLLLVALLGLAMRRREPPTLPEEVELFRAPLALAADPKIFEVYGELTRSLQQIAANKDPVYRGLALDRVGRAAGQLRQLAQGRVVFDATETWRMAYGQLLESPGLHCYRSIAHVKTSTYWQDGPGRQSMQINYDLIAQGKLQVRRIVILPDNFWPAGEVFPVEPVASWLDEQHAHGVDIRLVRQSALTGDMDLVVDLGIYGTRGVGYQELDDRGGTSRFVLSFDFAEVVAAEQRWERLAVYAVFYQQLLDPAARPR